MSRAPRPILGQLDLFDGEPQFEPSRRLVEPAAPDESLRQLAARLPGNLWLGTSSWSFPGWNGTVYAGTYPEARLAKHGLAACARHPLLRAVGVDRTFYASIPAQTYAEYAAAVPADFRFLVKAPEILTVSRFPHNARYRGQEGQNNPGFLSPDVAMRELVEPARLGLGSRLGCLLFQFPPQSARELGGAGGFAARLYPFLEALPRGLPYAVELRNRELFGPAYCEVLERWGVSHCLNIHPDMPDLERQLEVANTAPLCVVRWMLNPGIANYTDALERFAPFDRLRQQDLATRVALAGLCRQRHQAGLPTLVIVNNKAEGCAPLSLRALAECILAG